MNNAKNGALLVASLSIYKGILKRTVVSSFYNLLKALHSTPIEFCEKWGSFFDELSRRGYGENFSGCLLESALYDENIFSLSAAGNKDGDLSLSIKKAIKRDLSVLCEIASISSLDLKQAFLELNSDCEDIVLSLPDWEKGEFPEIIDKHDIEKSAKDMAEYYSKNGCGMYARYKAFVWRDGDIQPVPYPDPIKISSLKNYEYQRSLAVDNTVSFIKGLTANNCLLYGDRGTGKSSTVKALLNEYYKDGLRVVEMPKESLCDFPLLVAHIARLPLKFIIFIDDLSFSNQDSTYASLKAILEGGVASRPDNALIYATSNRRHLLKESFSDREGDEVHLRDTIQESLSLADRFGLSINYSTPNKKEYLEIVHALAKERNIIIDDHTLEINAERWATQRSGRSPRCAKQFIAMVEARIAQGLDIDC